MVLLCGFGRSSSSGVHARLSDVLLMTPCSGEDGGRQWKFTVMDIVGNGLGILFQQLSDVTIFIQL